jgi:hypothetical protein
MSVLSLLSITEQYLGLAEARNSKHFGKYLQGICKG